MYVNTFLFVFCRLGGQTYWMYEYKFFDSSMVALIMINDFVILVQYCENGEFFFREVIFFSTFMLFCTSLRCKTRIIVYLLKCWKCFHEQNIFDPNPLWFSWHIFVKLLPKYVRTYLNAIKWQMPVSQKKIVKIRLQFGFRLISLKENFAYKWNENIKVT